MESSGYIYYDYDNRIIRLYDAELLKNAERHEDSSLILESITSVIQNPNEVYLVRGSNDIQYYIKREAEDSLMVMVSMNEFTELYGVQNRIIEWVSLDNDSDLLSFLNPRKLVYQQEG